MTTAGTQGTADHFPALDGYRALAAFGVLVCHVGFNVGAAATPHWGPLLRRGDAGVAVFFVLSGFLLYRPFLQALLDGRRGPAVGPYLKRRALRIFPAYWLALAVIIGWIGVVRARPLDYLGWLSLTQIYRSQGAFLGPGIHGATGGVGYPLGLAWTLSVEVSFYAFLPVFAALLGSASARRSPRGRWRLQVGALAGMWVFSMALRLLVNIWLPEIDANFYNHWLPMEINLFVLGMGLALLFEAAKRDVLPAWAGRVLDGWWLRYACWGLAALSFYAVSNWVGLGAAEFYHSTSHDMALQVLYGATALLLLLPDTVRPFRRGVAPRVFAGFPLRQLGMISYGIYLWQDVVIDQYFRHTHHSLFAAPFLPALLWVAAATILIAVASYYVVERPALRLKHRQLLWSRRVPSRGAVP